MPAAPPAAPPASGLGAAATPNGDRQPTPVIPAPSARRPSAATGLQQHSRPPPAGPARSSPPLRPRSGRAYPEAARQAGVEGRVLREGPYPREGRQGSSGRAVGRQPALEAPRLRTIRESACASFLPSAAAGPCRVWGRGPASTSGSSADGDAASLPALDRLWTRSSVYAFPGSCADGDDQDRHEQHRQRALQQDERGDLQVAKPGSRAARASPLPRRPRPARNATARSPQSLTRGRIGTKSRRCARSGERYHREDVEGSPRGAPGSSGAG